MHKSTPVTRTNNVRSGPRKAWIAPVVQQIKAGEAEVGTRSTKDGTFTLSLRRKGKVWAIFGS